MNKEQFLSAKLKNISHIYSGKRDCCRCGCKGDYVRTSFTKNPALYLDINDTLAERRLRRAKKLVEQGARAEYWDFGVEVETGNDRCLTFYFEDVEKNISK